VEEDRVKAEKAMSTTGGVLGPALEIVVKPGLGQKAVYFG
jgi:hypothetical protein